MDAIANNAARASTAVSNTSNLYLDALVQCQFFISTGTLASSPVISIYAYALSYNTGYTDGVTGTDAAYTMPSVPNLKLAQIVSYTGSVNGSTVYTSPFSIASCFGGILPSSWGIVMYNQTGCTLAGTSGQQVNNTASYIGVNVTNG